MIAETERGREELRSQSTSNRGGGITESKSTVMDENERHPIR